MLYFDTSIVVPVVFSEATSERVETFVRSIPLGELATSHWTRVEFASTLAREVRLGNFNQPTADGIERDFDTLISDSFELLLPTADDFETAKAYLRQYESGLRGGDALHLAIAANRNAKTIYTLDIAMIKAGRMLGLTVERGIH